MNDNKEKKARIKALEQALASCEKANDCLQKALQEAGA